MPKTFHPPVPLGKNRVLLPMAEADGKNARGVILTMTKSKRSQIKPYGAKEIRDLEKQKTVIEPYVRTNVALSFSATSSIHAICLMRKARVVAGLGIKPITRDKEGKFRRVLQDFKKGKMEISDDDVKKAQSALDKIESEQKALQEWLDVAGGGDISLREVLERAWYDWENLGWAALEIVRSGGGKPAEINHVPAHLIRMTKERDKFVYFRSPTKKVWFKKLGDKRHLDVETGNFSDKPLPDKQEANELMFWSQYSPLDLNYGIPQWYSALAEIVGSTEARDFMLYFFTKRAIPSYAVILEGGTWDTNTLELIKRFFRTDLTKDYHSTLALETPVGAKITFERIVEEPRGVELTQQYMRDLRDVIISVHGLFPALVGVIETAHLGSGTGDAQMTLFKNVEIRPKQEILENLLNRKLVWDGLGFKTQMLKLDEIDLYDEEANARMVSELYCNADRPALSTNAALKMLRQDPLDEDGADELLFRMPAGGYGTLTDVLKASEQTAQPPQPPQQQQQPSPEPPFGGDQFAPFAQQGGY